MRPPSYSYWWTIHKSCLQQRRNMYKTTQQLTISRITTYKTDTQKNFNKSQAIAADNKYRRQNTKTFRRQTTREHKPTNNGQRLDAKQQKICSWCQVSVRPVHKKEELSVERKVADRECRKSKEEKKMHQKGYGERRTSEKNTKFTSQTTRRRMRSPDGPRTSADKLADDPPRKRTRCSSVFTLWARRERA